MLISYLNRCAYGTLEASFYPHFYSIPPAASSLPKWHLLHDGIITNFAFLGKNLLYADKPHKISQQLCAYRQRTFYIYSLKLPVIAAFSGMSLLFGVLNSVKNMGVLV